MAMPPVKEDTGGPGSNSDSTGLGGPGLGGTVEGIERSGPPLGMGGGDTDVMEGADPEAGKNHLHDLDNISEEP